MKIIGMSTPVRDRAKLARKKERDDAQEAVCRAAAERNLTRDGGIRAWRAAELR